MYPLCLLFLFYHWRIKLFMYRIWWLTRGRKSVLCDLFPCNCIFTKPWRQDLHWNPKQKFELYYDLTFCLLVLVRAIYKIHCMVIIGLRFSIDVEYLAIISNPSKCHINFHPFWHPLSIYFLVFSTQQMCNDEVILLFSFRIFISNGSCFCLMWRAMWWL